MPFRGVHLEVVGTQVAVRDVTIQVPDRVEIRNTGHGGLGLWTHGGEGCAFDNLRIEHTQQAMLIGGANHLFTQLRGSRNFKILSYDVSSGGHTFINSKFVNAGHYGQGPHAKPVETIRIGRDSDGNGASTFIACDWDESSANSVHTVVGDRSEFIRCVTAAGFSHGRAGQSQRLPKSDHPRRGDLPGPLTTSSGIRASPPASRTASDTRCRSTVPAIWSMASSRRTTAGRGRYGHPPLGLTATGRRARVPYPSIARRGYPDGVASVCEVPRTWPDAFNACTA